MNTFARPEPAVAPATELAEARARLRRRAPQTALFMVLLCSGIAVLLSVMGRGQPMVHVVYSFCIGAVCWAAHEGTGLAMAGLADRLRRWRGLPPWQGGSGWRRVWPAVAVSILVGPALGVALADAITGRQSASLLDLGSTGSRVTLVVTVIACLVAVAVLSSVERLASARAQAEAAQRQATEHQLRLLQSQLEPHMLFNTLANLRVLIGLDPARAQAMLDRLIAFLRSTLAASRAERHPLDAEFERTADYLALMAIRMGPRLQSRLELPAGLGALPVPPLLLQPLVENCIHHGLEPKVDGGRIDVQARREGTMLVLTVRDTGVGLGAAAVPGTRFGLTQVRERLATVYGGRATFTLEAAADAEGGTLATVRLPLE